MPKPRYDVISKSPGVFVVRASDTGGHYEYFVVVGRRKAAALTVRKVPRLGTDTYYIENLYVKPGFRRLGLAKLLLNIVTATHRGHTLALRAGGFGERSLTDSELASMYRRAGFQRDDKGVFRKSAADGRMPSPGYPGDLEYRKPGGNWFTRGIDNLRGVWDNRNELQRLSLDPAMPDRRDHSVYYNMVVNPGHQPGTPGIGLGPWGGQGARDQLLGSAGVLLAAGQPFYVASRAMPWAARVLLNPVNLRRAALLGSAVAASDDVAREYQTVSDLADATGKSRLGVVRDAVAGAADVMAPRPDDHPLDTAARGAALAYVTAPREQSTAGVVRSTLGLPYALGIDAVKRRLHSGAEDRISLGIDDAIQAKDMKSSMGARAVDAGRRAVSSVQENPAALLPAARQAAALGLNAVVGNHPNTLGGYAIPAGNTAVLLDKALPSLHYIATGDTNWTDRVNRAVSSSAPLTGFVGDAREYYMTPDKVMLSPYGYDKAAPGVIAHEAGHGVQDPRWITSAYMGRQAAPYLTSAGAVGGRGSTAHRLGAWAGAAAQVPTLALEADANVKAVQHMKRIIDDPSTPPDARLAAYGEILRAVSGMPGYTYSAVAPVVAAETAARQRNSQAGE